MRRQSDHQDDDGSDGKLLTADRGRSIPRIAKEATAFGVFVFRAGGEGTKDYVLFVQIANRAVEVIEDIVKSFQKSQAKVRNLPSTLKRYARIVIDDMATKVSRQDQESFVVVAQVVVNLRLDVYKMCEKWKTKNWLKKRLAGAQIQLTTYLVEVLESFAAVMEGHAQKTSKAMLEELTKLRSETKNVEIDSLDGLRKALESQSNSRIAKYDGGALHFGTVDAQGSSDWWLPEVTYDDDDRGFGGEITDDEVFDGLHLFKMDHQNLKFVIEAYQPGKEALDAIARLSTSF